MSNLGLRVSRPPSSPIAGFVRQSGVFESLVAAESTLPAAMNLGRFCVVLVGGAPVVAESDGDEWLPLSVGTSFPSSLEYPNLATLLSDTEQESGTTGYAPSFAAPEHIRQWDGADWLAVLEYWDGVSVGQTEADVATTPAVENAVILVGDPYSLTNSVATFAALSGLTNPPQNHVVEVTAESGYSNVFVRWDSILNEWNFLSITVTGADVAAVNAGIAALGSTGVNVPTQLTATIGADSWDLIFDAVDSRWYGVVEDGSELSPYTTATASGSGALASLAAPYTDAYAVIARGSGSPVVVRGLAVTSSGDGYVSWFWVPAAVHALGSPSTADVIARYPDATDWTIAPSTGGAASIAANGGLVRLTNGTLGITQISSIANRGAATRLGMFFRGFTTGSVTALGTNSSLAARTTSDSNQGLFFGWGGTVSPGGQTTKVNVYDGTGALVDSGVTLASLTYWCAVLDIGTNTQTIYGDGVALFSGTSIITSGTVNRMSMQTQDQNGSTFAFSTYAGATWT